MESLALTALIHRMQAGDREAADTVFQHAAERLREISSVLLLRDGSRENIRPSDLVHDLYLRKIRSLGTEPKIKDRHHFFALARRGMQQLLIDLSRTRNRKKRQQVAIQAPAAASRELLLDLQTCLDRLRALDPITARVLRLRHEAGFTVEEVSRQTSLTVHQVRSRERFALQWVRDQLARRSA